MQTAGVNHLALKTFNLVNLDPFALPFYTALFTIIAFVTYKYAWKGELYKLNSRKIRCFSVLGNIADYLSTAREKKLRINTYLLQIVMGYHQLFKREGFFIFWLSFWPFVMVYKAKTVEELISGSKNMDKSWFYDWLHPWLGTGLLTSSGKKWKSRRKLLTPAFHFDILKDFLPIFNEQSHLLSRILEEEKGKPWIDIVKPVTLCSLDILCETTLGVSIGAQKDSESEYIKAVSRAADNITKRFAYPLFFFDWGFNLSPTGFQFRKDVKTLHGFTRKVIAEKKKTLLRGSEDTSKKKRKALLDLLLEQHMQNQAITEEDIREELDTFVFEGHDTTSMGMSFALYLIGLHKNVQENIHEELDRIFGDDSERDITTDDLKDMEYLDRVLKESQRLYPSVPVIGRRLSQDTTINGTLVPGYFNAVVLVYALHRDEAVFPNPERFDPDRFLPENAADRNPFAYIPFSAGPRNCIGQRFAVMEEKVVIANILRNFSVESLDPRDKVLLSPEVIIRPASAIRMRLRPRRPASSN